MQNDVQICLVILSSNITSISPVQVRLQINYTRHDRSRDAFEDHVPGTDQCLQD